MMFALVALMIFSMINITYSAAGNDAPCTEDANCTSNHCESDYEIANGMFCAQDGTSCVHKKPADTNATQYDDGDEGGNYKCDSGAWGLKNDYPCNVNSDCYSAFCRSDYEAANGKFCAQDGTSCVHKKPADTEATQYDNGDKYKGRKCITGTWNLQDADSDEVCDEDDSCPNTPGGCNVGNGKIDATTGCPVEPVSGYHIKAGVVDSCPASSIPVDPQESDCLEAGIVNSLDILFFLKTGAAETGINNLSDCNLQSGTVGWHDQSDGNKYCEFGIPATTVPGVYELLAKYTINGINYEKVFHPGFNVTAACSLSSVCSHGGHILGNNTLTAGTITFDKPFTTDAGVYITCEGAKGTISGVQTYTAQCSNGVTGGATNPGLFAWTYAHSNPFVTLGYADNQFQGGTFATNQSHRDNLFTTNKGYQWTTNLGWGGGAAANSVNDFYAFDNCSSYRAYVDYIDNMCDAPDYICPNNGGICDIGSLDTEGFVALTNYDITIINPSVDLSANPVTDTYYVCDPYIPSKKKSYSWSVINNGTGKLNLSNIAVTCPPKLACISSPTMDIIVDDGNTEIIINTNFTLPCEYSVTSYPITLTFDVIDYYGLGCHPTGTETVTTTIIQGNVSDDSPASCECYTGKNNLWDNGLGCCDSTDCWLSGDKTWICDNGHRIEGTNFCEEEHACEKTWYWNKSLWAEKLPTGCGCEDSEDCESGECITGVCLELANPNISFSSGSFTIELGSKVQTVISIENNIAVEDTIKIAIHTHPGKMEFWTEFTNGKNEIDISLNAYEEKLIPIEIFGGETGTYKLTLYGTSKLVPSLYGKDEQNIMIVAKESGINSRSPGLQLLSVITLLLIAGFLALGKRKN